MFFGKGDYSNLLHIFQSEFLEIISEFWFYHLFILGKSPL